MSRKSTAGQTVATSPADLRRQAEGALAQVSEGTVPADVDTAKTMHELRVHQIELEMQNLELQRSAQALTESQERLRLAMLATNDVIWDWDVIADRQTWDGAASAVFGWTDIVERPQTAGWWMERVHADDRERVVLGFDAALADPDCERWEDEYRFRHLDGRYRAVYDRATILRDAAGRALRMVGAMRDVTERRHIDARMRQLSLAVEQSSNGIVITDLEGRIEYINAAGAATSGYAVEELLGRNPRILQSGRTSPDAYEALWRTLAAGEVWHGEFVNRRKNGEVYVEAETISPVRQADGRVSHYVGIKEDVTDRRRAESALRESERRFQDIATASADWVWEVDADGLYSFVSDGITELLGYTPQEILGKTPFDLMPPEEAARIGAEFAAIVSRREAFRELENTVRHKDGSLRHVLTNGVPILNSDGALLGYRGLDRDITERRRIGEHLQSLLDEQKAILDSRIVGIVRLRDRKYVWANEVFAEMLGYTLQELAGQSARIAYVSEEAYAGFAAMAYPAMLNGGTFRTEAQFRRKDGSLGWFEVSGSRLESESDESIWACMDITQRRAAEENCNCRPSSSIRFRTTSWSPILTAPLPM